MSKIVRNILCVCLGLATVFVVLICLGIGVGAQNDIYYDLVYDAELEIVEVHAEKLGKTYNHKASREDKTFYRLELLLENDSNITVGRSGSRYSIDVEDGYAEIVYEDGFFSGASYSLIPAGEQGMVSMVVEIPDGSQTAELYTWEDEDVRYEILLPQ